LIDTSTLEEATSVDPESNWQGLILESRRADNVEVKTIFRDWVIPLIAAVAVTLTFD
jgi:hypothetical protein